MLRLNMVNKDKEKFILDFNPMTCQLFKCGKQYEFDCEITNNQKINYNELSDIRIQLGLACNYNCKYCNQGHIKPKMCSNKNIQKFVTDLYTYLNVHQTSQDLNIQFWGGEPFLYFKTIKLLVQELKRQNTKFNLKFSTVSNGSLITNEIIQFLKNENFFISISNDGPNSTLRSENCLITNGENIKTLFMTLDKENTAISTVFNKDNKCDIKSIVNYFQEWTGDESIKLMECCPVAVTNDDVELTAYKLNSLELFKQLLQSEALNCVTLQMVIGNFIRRIIAHTDIELDEGQCPAFINKTLTVNLNGDILPCQAFDISVKSDIIPGHLSDMELIEFNLPSWKTRSKCNNCPILFFCRGGCPYNDEYKNDECFIKFNFYIQVLQFALYAITGGIIQKIEGDFFFNKGDSNE